MWSFITKNEHSCPPFRGRTTQVHSDRNQHIRDPTASHLKVNISSRKQRYRFKECEKPFCERLHMVNRYQRCTMSLERKVMITRPPDPFKRQHSGQGSHSSVSDNVLVEDADETVVQGE
ncbi:transposase family protein [Salimicrobium salexigens]|uniref:transposase family protein n=1 Tax=Salimicrobium salexigens TaxID=908941 RepID=UPI0038997F10